MSKKAEILEESMELELFLQDLKNKFEYDIASNHNLGMIEGFISDFCSVHRYEYIKELKLNTSEYQARGQTYEEPVSENIKFTIKNNVVTSSFEFTYGV